MAMQGGQMKDQNLNAPFNGPLGIKTNASKARKSGGLGGRRALNDISNSGRPFTLQTSKKLDSSNLTSAGEDIGPSKMLSFGGNKNASKATKRVQAGGRKALQDLTNAGKPHVHQVLKKNHDKKLSAVAEQQILPHAVVEEQFLHNHNGCIKAQGKSMDMDYFLKTIGLDTDDSMQFASPWVSPLPSKVKPQSSPSKYLEMEEMPDLLYEDLLRWKKTELPSKQTCYKSTPKSPKSGMQWKDYNLPDYILMETPKSLKH